MRIYVASSWRNPFQPAVVEMLREHDHEVYDFRNPRPGERGFSWSEISPAWREWTPQQFRDALHDPTAHAGFESDFNAMKWADTCVMVMPCGRSAHLEAGYFVGAEKRLVIFMPEPSEAELMYSMADRICTSWDELQHEFATAATPTA